MAQTSGGMSSWASLLGGNPPTRNDKNVMEIVLEKDMKGNFKATDQEVARVLQKLGADIRPGVHIEGIQICPMGKNVIQVTLNKNVEIERFSNKDLFEVKTGMRISHIRKSGQREVMVTVKGLHPNTPDETVFEYLRCLGKIEKKKVIMDTYKVGPLAGFQNGDRKYSIELRTDVIIGPVHVIDGHKVMISFSGQRRFCFRCLKTDRECAGKGIARECEASGGEKVFLSDYLLGFWQKIGFSSDKPNIPIDMDETESANIEIQVGENFTPKAHARGTGAGWGGVTVKWFPKRADHGDIKGFLIEHGLPEEHQDINIKDNGQVVIESLNSENCKKLSDSISGKLFKNKKMIYCNPFVPLTPEKRSDALSSVSDLPIIKTSIRPPPPPSANEDDQRGQHPNPDNVSSQPMSENQIQDPFGDFPFSPEPRPISQNYFMAQTQMTQQMMETAQ